MHRPRTLVFKPCYWSYEEDKDFHTLDIHVGGLTARNETVHVIVRNFRPWVYVQLPARIQWTAVKCKALYEHICKMAKPMELETYEDSVKHVRRQKLHYLEEAEFLRILLPTHSVGRKLAWRLRRSFTIFGLGSFAPKEVCLHEHNIDPLIKFTAQKHLQLADWIEAFETIPEGEEEDAPEVRKFSSASYDFFVIGTTWNLPTRGPTSQRSSRNTSVSTLSVIPPTLMRNSLRKSCRPT